MGGSRLLARAAQQLATTIVIRRDQVVSAQRDDVSHIYFIESGFTASKKLLRDGRQLTLGISVPGDIVDYEALTVGAVFSTTYALGETRLLQVPIKPFEVLIYANPSYQKLFLRFVAYQGVLAKEWLVRVGRLSATEKTAHLICELLWRLDPVGHVQNDFCSFPLRQSEWADILGVSLVQQNRSLAALRTQGLVEWSSKGFQIKDRKRLERLANFDPAYLEVALSQEASLGSPMDETLS